MHSIVSATKPLIHSGGSWSEGKEKGYCDCDGDNVDRFEIELVAAMLGGLVRPAQKTVRPAQKLLRGKPGGKTGGN